MNTDWVVAAIVLGIIFYVAYQFYDGIGLFTNSIMSLAFGAAFMIGALIVIVLLVKPFFFPSQDVPNQ